MPSAPVCVIVNPRAGRRQAAQVDEFRHRFGAGFDLKTTTAPGHAEELALDAAMAGYATVVAAGGDGTVHEVANGLLRADRPEVVFQVVPVGSANDYAHSIELLARTEGQPVDRVLAVDVGLARREGKERYFVNGLGLGFNGGVTLESRKISWLRGVPLYTLALFRALVRHFRSVPMTVALDDKPDTRPTVALSLNVGRREGNFVMAPEAQLDDGLFDYLWAGNLKRWEIVRFVPGMIAGRLPSWHPEIRMGRCKKLAVQSPEPLTVHVDGEFLCVPEDGVRALEVDLLPGRLKVRWGE